MSKAIFVSPFLFIINEKILNAHVSNAIKSQKCLDSGATKNYKWQVQI